jgi:hypothetical protein
MSLEAAERSPDWVIRFIQRSKITPTQLGLCVAILYPIVVGIIHIVGNMTMGPVELARGALNFAGNVTVNGALAGLLLAGRAQLYFTAIADLHQLRPTLSGGDEAFAHLVRNLPNLTRTARWWTTILGIIGGLAVATLDPSLVEFYRNFAPADPRFLTYLVANALFGALVSRLFATEVHLARAYNRLGERVEIDLLAQTHVLVFARKGLRSVVIWVLISSIFSIFWVLDSAGQANIALSMAVLGLATVAFVAPTLGVHRNIRNQKAQELAILAEAIRVERAAVLAPRRTGMPPEDARLGNLIQYQTFVKAIREWPFDLSIVSRSSLLIVLGAGSWLGGAVVERLLNLLLD